MGWATRQRGAVHLWASVCAGLGAVGVVLVVAFGGVADAARTQGVSWGATEANVPFGLFESAMAARERALMELNARAGQLGLNRLLGGSTTSSQSFTTKNAALAADTNVAVGQMPTGVAVNATRAYVANSQSNSVSVIDLTLATPSVIATIPVGAFPVGVALSADGAQAYVTNYQAGTLSIISTASNTVTNTVTVGSRPNGVIRVGATVYVANLIGNSISVVDPVAATVTNTVVLGGSPLRAPSGLAANAAGTRLYASDARNGRLLVLDLTVSPPSLLSSSTVVGAFPAYLAVANGTGYVANPGSNSVSVVDLSPSPPTVTATITGLSANYGIVAQPSLGQVLITNSGSSDGRVMDVGTGALVGTFPTGNKPNAIALTPDGQIAVFSNQGSNTVSVVHVNQAPVNTVPGAQSVNGNGTGSANTLTFSGGNSNLISTSDSDANGGTVKATLGVNDGILTLSTTAGLAFTSGANGTASMAFTGTLAAVNTAIAGLVYTPDTGFFGSDTLTYTLEDQGNTGIGKAQSDTDAVTINVVNVAPAVGNVSFSGAVGNTIFGVGTTPAQPSTSTAGTVLSNSTDANNHTLTAVAGMITSTNGATVNMNANGTFTYLTSPGGATGNDTFTFQVTDGIATTNGTATVTVANRVWYVNNALAPAGDGRSTSPLNALTILRGAGDLDAPGDHIFLYQGISNYTGGLPLEANQRLVGQPEGLVVNSVTLLPGSGSNPTITNGAGVGIQLANDTVIRRVNVSGTSAQGIHGTTVTNVDVGPNLSVTNSTGVGFSLDGAATGTVTMAGTITHSSPGAGSVFVQNRTGGTVTFSAAISDTNGGGIFLNNNDNVTINFTGGITASTGANKPFTAQAGGTVNVTGTNTLSTTSGPALTVTDTGIGASGLTFQSINTNGGTSGVVLSNTGSAGGLTVTGTGGAGLGGTIQNTTGDGISLTNVGGVVSLTNMATSNVTGTDVLLNGGGANFTYTGTITNQAGKGRSVSVANRTGGTTLFSGAIDDNGSGISLSSNTGATINFTGGIILSTTANEAFAATGGGVVNVTGTNVITTTTGRALNVANTTIGASGLTFRSISAGTGASGPANGILLNNTGTSGGLTVSGTGSAGSGGTIQRTTSDSISLTTTRSVNLSHMVVQNSQESGILGSGVTNLNLTSCTFTNNGDDAGDDGIRVANLLGTSTWSSLSMSGSARNNVFVDNFSGTLDSLTVSGTSHFDSVSPAFGAQGFLLQARGTAVVTSGSISGATFQNNKPARGITVQAQEGGRIGDASTNAFTVQNSVFTNNGLQASFEQSGTANLTFKLLNNGSAGAPMTMPNTAVGTSHAVNVFSSSASTAGTIRGRISGNFIGNSGVAGSGSAIGNGIRTLIQGKTVATLLYDANTIRQTPQARGIDIQVLGPLDGTGSSTHDITVTNNDVNPQDSTGFPTAAIYVAADSQGGGTVTVRTDIRGNTVPAGAAVDSFPTFLILDEVAAGAVCQLVDTAPASASATAQLTSTNTGSASAAAGCALIAGPITTPP